MKHAPLDHAMTAPAGRRPSPPGRRLRTLALALLCGVGGVAPLAGCDDDADPQADAGTAPPQQLVRRSASAMTAEQIDRFQRAFSYAVSEGWFDAFCDSHGNGHGQRMHGGEVQPDTPVFIMINPTLFGHRLLPWHRSFIREAEVMLQAALRARNAAEGRDPAEADQVFIPYWDAAHDQAVSAWVADYLPAGGTAVAPENLPEGHVGRGHEGQRYDIAIGRWPGTNPGFPHLAPPDQIARILAHDTFVDFYKALDFGVEIDPPEDPVARAALDALAELLPDSAAVATLLDAIATGALSNEQAVDVLNALARLGYEAAVAASRGAPDLDLEEALALLTSAIRPPPHALMHFWAGGLDPSNPDVRGTVTYFHELCVDPLFWMLHTELDRYWFSWSRAHDGIPPLEGDDATFQPISAEVGASYGGGRRYTLDELSDLGALPFTYDAVFVP